MLPPTQSKGSVLVELAVAVPLLTLLAFGVYDYGRNLNIYQGMERILQEGLRVASRDEGLSKTPLGGPNTWSPAVFTNFLSNDGSPNTIMQPGGHCIRGSEIVCRILELTIKNFGNSVTINYILIDYDITRNEEGEPDNIPGGQIDQTQPCSRTIRGELSYSVNGPSFFSPILGGKVSARVPYFKIGPREDGERCGRRRILERGIPVEVEGVTPQHGVL
jgi:hypothetical protein